MNEFYCIKTAAALPLYVFSDLGIGTDFFLIWVRVLLQWSS